MWNVVQWSRAWSNRVQRKLCKAVWVRNLMKRIWEGYISFDPWYLWARETPDEQMGFTVQYDESYCCGREPGTMGLFYQCLLPLFRGRQALGRVNCDLPWLIESVFQPGPAGREVASLSVFVTKQYIVQIKYKTDSCNRENKQFCKKSVMAFWPLSAFDCKKKPSQWL